MPFVTESQSLVCAFSTLAVVTKLEFVSLPELMLNLGECFYESRINKALLHSKAVCRILLATLVLHENVHVDCCSGRELGGSQSG